MESRICAFANKNQLMKDYHDFEWCKETYSDQVLFEYLILETMQAGLSWDIVLQKRENMRRAYSDFDPYAISQYNESDLTRLKNDDSIIKNTRKIQSVVKNANAYLSLQKDNISFCEYIWSFVNEKQIINEWITDSDMPSKTDVSAKMSADMKKRGFSFVGPVICYSFMQAAGLVNDHIIGCPAR